MQYNREAKTLLKAELSLSLDSAILYWKIKGVKQSINENTWKGYTSLLGMSNISGIREDILKAVRCS